MYDGIDFTASLNNVTANKIIISFEESERKQKDPGSGVSGSYITTLCHSIIKINGFKLFFHIAGKISVKTLSS